MIHVHDLVRDVKKANSVVGLSRTQLSRLVRYCNDRYHNEGVVEGPALPDRLFDLAVDALREIDPDNRALLEIGSPVKVVKGKRKVELPHFMPSLTKVKPDTVEQWIEDNPGPYVVSRKLDGASLEHVFVRGGSKLYTRGNGTIGQDVSHLIPYLDLPTGLPAGTAVRLELTLSEAEFRSFADDFENARQLASGLVNRSDGGAHPAIKKVKPIAHELISPRMKTSAGLARLKSWGYNVVHHVVLNAVTPASLSRILAEQKRKSPVLIDGLVVEVDRVNRRPTVYANPAYAVAYKEMDESAVVQVRVEDVIWSKTKFNRWQPRITIPPTRMGGVTVTKATAHNAYFILNGFRYKDRNKGLPVRPLGPGAVIRIVRSGDVIPHIVEVVKAARKPKLPPGEWKYGPNGVTIISSEKDDTARDKRIAAFFTKMGVENIKLGVVQKLTAAGFDTTIKILRMSVDDLLTVPGFKINSATKLHESIRSKTVSAPLEILMEASGLFGSGLGSKRLLPMVKKYREKMLTWENASEAALIEYATAIPNFSTKTGTIFAKGMPKFLRWLGRSRIKPEFPKALKQTGTAMKGQVVVFTGYRDADAEQWILKNGGRVAGSVNAETTLLVVKDLAKSSTKVTKAKQLGVKVIAREVFERKMNPS